MHNLVVVEEGASSISLRLRSHPGVISGLHVGVSEFYVRQGGKLTFTMIHNWGEEVHVRPRTAIMVEAAAPSSPTTSCCGGKSVLMYPPSS